MYVPALGLLQIWEFLDNIKSHLGYEFFPSWWNKIFGKLMTSSTHHNMHYSKFNGNYELIFVFGTGFWEQNLTTMKKHLTKYKKEKGQPIPRVCQNAGINAELSIWNSIELLF